MHKKILFLAVLAIFLAPVCFAAATGGGLPPVVDLATNTGIIITIDPAHGGGDWGVNYHGVTEKEITLKVAKLIKQKMEKVYPDVKVFLTRDGDNFITPAERVGSANSKKSSLYISVHCDYVVAQEAEGFAVYYPSGDNIYGKRQETAVINWEDVQLYHIADSIKLAGFISQYMLAPLIAEKASADGGEANDTVPMAERKGGPVNHYSLMGADMPAVAVELGNLNNSNDFGYLKDDRMLGKIAYHMVEGISHFIKGKGGAQ